MPRLRPILHAALVALTAGTLAAGADQLFVLVGGHVLRVDGYELVEPERFRLLLESGGTLLLPLSRVERIVDAEVSDEPPPQAPVFDLGFARSSPVPETPFGELIWDASRRHEVNPILVAEVVRAESAFDPRAVSRKGARGLMQLMPATAERFGVGSRELFQPERNLEAGVGYLAWLAERFDGDLPRVLAAYNAGEGAVERYSGVPPYRETRDYLARIFDRLGLTALPHAGAGSGSRD